MRAVFCRRKGTNELKKARAIGFFGFLPNLYNHKKSFKYFTFPNFRIIIHSVSENISKIYWKCGNFGRKIR